MASSIGSPISEVPYDVLREIFVNCLPQYRLKHRQPNTTIAPILLCHVCSSWRMVALAIPALWSHLSYRFTVAAQSDNFFESDWIVLKNQYAFLMWWKKNQCSIAPSLCLDVDWQYDSVSEPEAELELDTVGLTSLFEYISSAHYIEIDGLYWCVLAHRIQQRGYPIVYPIPRTLVVSLWDIEQFDCFYHDQLSLRPNDSPSALQNLYFSGDIYIYKSFIPNHWSSLTHVVLFICEMSLNFWFSLIRAVPHLQLGHFDIGMMTGYEGDYMQPTRCTLSQLSTFSVAVSEIHDEPNQQFALGILFTELHLPALCDLSLSSYEAWSDHHALAHIYSVFNSAPVITTLTLGVSFLSLEDEKYFVQILPLIKDIEPIWSRAIHLVHLRLEVVSTHGQNLAQVEDARDTLIRNIFHHDSCWLDLHNAACPVQVITVVDRSQSHPQGDSIADLTRSSIQRHAEKVPNVKTIFEVISELQSQTATGEWIEWGPNLN